VTGTQFDDETSRRVEAVYLLIGGARVATSAATMDLRSQI